MRACALACLRACVHLGSQFYLYRTLTAASTVRHDVFYPDSTLEYIFPAFLPYGTQHFLYASYRTTRQNYILSVRACAVASVRACVHGCVRVCMILCARVWLRARVCACVYLNSQNYIETQRSRYYDIFYSYRTLLYVMFLYTMYPIRSTVKFLDPARGSVRRLGYFYSGF